MSICDQVCVKPVLTLEMTSYLRYQEYILTECSLHLKALFYVETWIFTGWVTSSHYQTIHGVNNVALNTIDFKRA